MAKLLNFWGFHWLSEVQIHCVVSHFDLMCKEWLNLADLAFNLLYGRMIPQELLWVVSGKLHLVSSLLYILIVSLPHTFDGSEFWLAILKLASEYPAISKGFLCAFPKIAVIFIAGFQKHQQ